MNCTVFPPMNFFFPSCNVGFAIDHRSLFCVKCVSSAVYRTPLATIDENWDPAKMSSLAPKRFEPDLLVYLNYFPREAIYEAVDNGGDLVAQRRHRPAPRPEDGSCEMDWALHSASSRVGLPWRVLDPSVGGSPVLTPSQSWRSPAFTYAQPPSAER